MGPVHHHRSPSSPVLLPPLILLILIILLMAPSILPLATQAGAEDWPMFLKDKHHTNTASSEAPLHPHILWQREVASDGIYASATVHDGKVFVGSMDRTMYALDASSGDEIWTYKTPDVQNGRGIDNSAAVSGGVVYFGSDDFRFYAVDEASGALKWSYTMSVTSANPQTYGIQASPVVSGGVVYTGADMSQGDNYELIDNLLALDADTGDVVWTFDSNGRVYSSPALEGTTLFVPNLQLQDVQGTLYAIDTGSGGPRRPPTVIWSKPFLHPFMGSPMIDGGRLYIGEGWYQDVEGSYNLFAFGLDGTEIWRYNVSMPIISTPVAYDGKIYFADYGGTVHAVDQQGNGDGTTDPIWSHHMSDYNVWSTTLLSDGRLYIGSLDKKLYCLDAGGNGDGTTYELWNMTLDGEVWASPVVVEGRLYITTLGGSVYCIEEDPAPPIVNEPEIDVVSAEPFDIPAGDAVTLTIGFKIGGDLSLLSEVYANMSPVGGPEKATMNDDGVNGDATAGDGTYSLSYIIPETAQEGARELDIVAILDNGRRLSEPVGIYVSLPDGDGGGGPGGKKGAGIPATSAAGTIAILISVAIAIAASRKRAF